MEVLVLFPLLLMATGASCLNILQPTGYDCNNAQGGLSQQAGILYDHNMPVDAGGLLLVAAEMEVERLARMRFYICPSEIPEELKEPWTFDCQDKIQLDVSRSYQSSMLDWKLQYYLNISFIQVHVPENFYCNRCGLQIEAEFKKTPRAEPDETETRCSFIHVHEDHVKPVTTTVSPKTPIIITEVPVTTTTTSTPADITDDLFSSTPTTVDDSNLRSSTTPAGQTVEPPEIEIAEPPSRSRKGNKKQAKKRRRNKGKGRKGKKTGRGKGRKH